MAVTHDSPHGREEEWRFTPLPRLKALLEDVASDAQLNLQTELPDGVTLTTIDAAAATARSVPPADRVADLAAAHAGVALLLTIPAETAPADPITLRFTGAGRDQVVWGQLLIDAGAGSSATVVIEHAGSAQYGALTSVDVGDGASLDLVAVQTWADDAVHAGQFSLRVGRDARVRQYTVTLGGETVRLVHTVDYTGPGGDAELLGLFFADAGQHLEHRLRVEHTAPHCRSNVVYKGALQGSDARTVWVGDVIIRADAIGTDTYEINRNLLLSRGARADSVPNLEIETGEVAGAGHASATGRFDDEQLFYLQARGIPADEARRLVVRGFFADLIDRIAVPELREQLTDAIEAELARSDA
jgi:Fe-S cluster assembly protein SufD